jgi:hypothetical protein
MAEDQSALSELIAELTSSYGAAITAAEMAFRISDGKNALGMTADEINDHCVVAMMVGAIGLMRLVDKGEYQPEVLDALMALGAAGGGQALIDMVAGGFYLCVAMQAPPIRDELRLARQMLPPNIEDVPEFLRGLLVADRQNAEADKRKEAQNV